MSIMCLQADVILDEQSREATSRRHFWVFISDVILSQDLKQRHNVIL